MPLDHRGFQSGRGSQPKGLQISDGVRHHMIGHETLGNLWNTMNRLQLRDQQKRFMDVIGFSKNHPTGPILESLDRGAVMQSAAGGAFTDLDSAITWQPFNLFVGPANQFRPAHSPDPNGPADIGKFFKSHGVTFDFPVVGPPHGKRAIRLHAVNVGYESFVRQASTVPPTRAQIMDLERHFDTVSEFAHLDMIPEYEVNWFALPATMFLNMSRQQRMAFTAAMRGPVHQRPGDPVAVAQAIIG